eukprot:CAMPEP_0113665724 /NCGR_PEP_ID=MMETSP0038_2-20120614/2463_1 /TAXON_ID=2898 /ORGANISM="Cryptomonas paramecium" /LENGTH=205 /DNA_ID=CAMNT_0000581107 /DNA_START=125 /DNA_END=738 /DNA_ORIENTATION=- /assembly_acc=CAM_ASM_000170
MEWKALRLIYLFLVISCAIDEKDASKQITVYKSTFSSGSKGWFVSGSGVKGPVLVHKSLCANDLGSSVWYWNAPPEFVDFLRSSYGGQLIVRRGFFEINRGGKEQLVDALFEYELYCDALGEPIGISNISQVADFHSEHAASLMGLTDWIHPNGTVLSEQWMRRALSTSTAFRIRGGHYHGPEYAYLAEVTILRALAADIPPTPA